MQKKQKNKPVMAQFLAQYQKEKKDIKNRNQSNTEHRICKVMFNPGSILEEQKQH